MNQSMPLSVFAIVLGAALLHATWNAIVKAAPDKLLTTVLVTSIAAAIAVAVLPLLGRPNPDSWSYAAFSAVLQVTYFLLVARAYEIADLSQTYPLMRGAAPLIVALVTAFQANEPLSMMAWTGILAICLGIFSMALGSPVRNRAGIYLSLLNAVVIAGYTVVDGIGVRRSGAPAAYTLLVFLFTGLPLAAWAIAAKHRSFLPYVARYWHLGLVGGIGTTASYGLALWAMTKAPVPVIAALRETSILFGTLIAWLFLGERIGRRRAFAVCIIAGGAALLRLA
ncbi:MAG TPA: DMT family transporter [Steroidobacteraceae bacterium]|nr:DMT family transporter [Steroidobacteraceae bacterium]